MIVAMRPEDADQENFSTQIAILQAKTQQNLKRDLRMQLQNTRIVTTTHVRLDQDWPECLRPLGRTSPFVFSLRPVLSKPALPVPVAYHAANSLGQLPIAATSNP